MFGIEWRLRERSLLNYDSSSSDFVKCSIILLRTPNIGTSPLRVVFDLMYAIREFNEILYTIRISCNSFGGHCIRAIALLHTKCDIPMVSERSLVYQI